MAKRPFFTGDYGSALGRIDTRPIMEAARAQAETFAGLGAEAAKAIETYQLNKEERAKLTGEIEQDAIRYAGQLTQTPNQETNQKNLKALEKFNKGDSSMSDMRYLAGQIGRIKANQLEDLTIESRKTIVDLNKENLALSKDTRASKQKLIEASAALEQLKVDLANATTDAQREAALAKLYAIPKLVDQQLKRGKQEIKMQKFNLTKKEIDNEVFRGLIEAFGSAEAYGAFKAGEMKNLSRLQKKKLKTDIEKGKALIDYYESQGLASILKQLQGDAPPTFNERFTQLAQQQAKLLSTTVELSSEGAREEADANRLTLKEYLEFNAEDPGLFPINGQVQNLNAVLKNTDLKLQDLMKEQKVSVFVPEGAGAGDAPGAVVEELDIRSLPVDNPTGAIANRVTELRNEVEGLEQELVELGKPGAKMTAPSQIPMGSGGSGFPAGETPFDEGRSATVGYVQDETKRIQGEINARRKEMERLTNELKKLGG